VTSDGAVVTLISDPSSGVSATVASTGTNGIAQPTVGDPTSLTLQYVPASAAGNVHAGDSVVTSGTVTSRLDSLYPPGIPIGQVTKVNLQSQTQPIHFRPFANLRKLDIIQVLTRGTQGVRPNAARLALAQLSATGSGSAGPGGGQTASTGGGRAGP
jgi:cell shape-determining protein MreC